MARTNLPIDLRSVGAARRLVEATLSGQGPGVIEEAVLLTAEVVTNAILHASTAVELVITLDDHRLRVEVYDDSPLLPVLRPLAVGATGGRGMLLVDALSDTWGVTPSHDGKTVWFELRLATTTAPSLSRARERQVTRSRGSPGGRRRRRRYGPAARVQPVPTPRGLPVATRGSGWSSGCVRGLR